MTIASTCALSGTTISVFTMPNIPDGPSTWGASLKAFYEQYYPGAEYRAVEAHTPAELEAMLANWSG